MARKRSRKDHQPVNNKKVEPKPQKVKRIKISKIKIGTRLRTLDRAKVKVIAASLDEIGLKTPITVRMKDGRLSLVAGLHRLKAAEKLDWEEIDAFVTTASSVEAELWEACENLMRAELSALDRAEHVNKFVALLKKQDSKRKDKHGKAGRPEGGNAKAARLLQVPGKTEDAVRKEIERDLKIAKMSPETKALVKKVGLQNRPTKLLAIAKEPDAKSQCAKVREMARGKQGDDDRSVGNRVESTMREVKLLLKEWGRCDPQARGLFSMFVRRSREFRKLYGSAA